MNGQDNRMPSDNTTPAIIFGLIVVITVFGFIGGWMYYAPLASTSVAVGQVVAGGVKQKVQHLDGGSIKKIYVKDGDVVKRGDILIELDDIQIKENLNILNSQYQTALATYARLKAQRDNLSSIDFPKGIKRSIIENQINIFNISKKSLRDEDLITKRRILQIKKQIVSLKALINSNKKRLRAISKQKEEQEILFAQQLVDKLKIQELEREANRIEGDIASKIADIARLREQINELETQKLLRKKKFKEDILDKLVKTKSQIEDLKSKIIATEDKLKRTKIKAPIAGTIVGLKFHTIGEVIRRGEDILEIVPKDSKLLIVAKVKTTDIDKVKVGLLAQVMFPAFNMRKIRFIEGRVISVSADSFIDKATHRPYYEAKIEVTKEGLDELKKHNYTLVAGMPATVMIQLGTRTTLEYILKPFQNMLIRGFNEE